MESKKSGLTFLCVTVVLVAILTLVSGCRQVWLTDELDLPQQPTDNPVNEITVSGPTVVFVGETISLTATVLPKSAEQKVSWKSEDITTATVDASTGEVRGVKAGSVEIVAFATDTSGTSTFHKVSVVDSDTTVDPNADLAIWAGDFEIGMVPASKLDELGAIGMAEAVAWVLSTENSALVSVDEEELGAIQGATDVGSYPLTFTATHPDSGKTVAKEIEVTVTLGNNPFVLVYSIPTADTVLTLPLRTGETVYDLVIDWGDETKASRVKEAADGSHEYAVEGDYTVKIYGDLRFGDIDGDGIDDGSFGSLYKAQYEHHVQYLKEVESFGEVQFINNPFVFGFITENVGLPADTADTPYIEGNMRGVFWDAGKFDQDLSGWDVSSVTNMVGMFYGAKEFNQDLSGWDVSSVTDMSWMFSDTTAFNQDLNSWNVGSVTDMSWMFSNASKFNQDISGWDVSSVTDMNGMFFSASKFNQDISGWDISSVTNMSSMFLNASAFINGDVSMNIDVNSNVHPSWDWTARTPPDTTDMFENSPISRNPNDYPKGF